MTSHWRHPVRRKQEVTKPEQEELWGRMEEQGRAGIFGAFKLLVSKQTLVSGRLCYVPFFGRVEWEERSGKKVKVLST